MQRRTGLQKCMQDSVFHGKKTVTPSISVWIALSAILVPKPSVILFPGTGLVSLKYDSKEKNLTVLKYDFC